MGPFLLFKRELVKKHTHTLWVLFAGPGFTLPNQSSITIWTPHTPSPLAPAFPLALKLPGSFWASTNSGKGFHQSETRAPLFSHQRPAVGIPLWSVRRPHHSALIPTGSGASSGHALSAYCQHRFVLVATFFGIARLEQPTRRRIREQPR